MKFEKERFENAIKYFGDETMAELFLEYKKHVIGRQKVSQSDFTKGFIIFLSGAAAFSHLANKKVSVVIAKDGSAS